jgi:hypothetical protein
MPFGISCRQRFYELQTYVVTDIIHQWLFIVILTYFTSLDIVLTWSVYWKVSNSVQVLIGSVSQHSGKENILTFIVQKIADLSGIAPYSNRVLIYESLILNDQFSIQQYHSKRFPYLIRRRREIIYFKWKESNAKISQQQKNYVILWRPCLTRCPASRCLQGSCLHHWIMRVELIWNCVVCHILKWNISNLRHLTVQRCDTTV